MSMKHGFQKLTANGKRRQIAMIALRKIAALGGYAALIARDALKDCREVAALREGR